jgi:Zn-dependent alcohol dehydrogenase
VVESVGEGVDNVKVGDRVIPLYTAGAWASDITVVTATVRRARDSAHKALGVECRMCRR